MGGSIVAVSCSGTYTFSKPNQDQIRLLEGLGVEGDALIDRMERTIARAERVSSTSHAALVQQNAVEKHLSSLSARAEKLIEGLGHAVERATESFARIESRSERTVRQAEEGVSSIVERVTR